MADQRLNDTNTVHQLFGERQRVAYQARPVLPQRIFEVFDVIGFPGFFCHSAVLPRRNRPFIDFILAHMARRLFTIDRRDIGTELLATLATSIPTWKAII